MIQQVNRENAVDFLAEQIRLSARHTDYTRTVEVRKFARQMMDLEPHDDIIERFRRFESEELKKQRKERLYVSPTGLIINRLRKYWRKVKRIDGAVLHIEAEEKQKERVAEMRSDLLDFEDAKPAFEWIVDTAERLGVTDPNAWIVYEREDDYTVGGLPTRTRVYPVVFSSVEALNFQIRFGNVEWAVFSSSRLHQETKGGRVENKWLTDFYLYGGGFTVRFRDAQKTEAEEGEEKKAIAGQGKKEQVFWWRIFETGYPYVPAMRVGCYEDDATEGRTFVAWFFAAKNALIDLIRDKNFLDITKAVHVFLRRYEYVKPCGYRDDKTGACCERGKLTGARDGTAPTTCPACDGHGLVANFTSEQQVLQLKMPENASNLLELAKLSFYENLPIELPNFLAAEFEKAERRVMLHVLNPGLLKSTAQNGDKTATEVEFDYQDVQAVVSQFAASVSKMIVLLNQTAAAYLDIAPNGDLAVSHRFPDDFRFETLAEAIRNFEAAKEAGIGYDAIKALRRRVWEKIFASQPEMVQVMEARMAWMPFDDKTQDETAAILAMRDPRDPVRILAENHAFIFEIIDAKHPQFHKYPKEAQQKAVAQVVTELTGQIVALGEELPEPVNPAADADPAE
jgi:hypothetical protein